MAATESVPAPAVVKSSSAAASQLKNFLSGGFGGMCLVLVGQPFDLIKVRLQTMVVAPGSASPYTGALDCARKTIAREGVRGLFKGMSAPLMGVTPIFAVCFWAYDAAKQIERYIFGLKSDKELTLNQLGIAGAASAIPTTVIMAPGERIKVILQVQDSSSTGEKRFKGEPYLFYLAGYAGGIDNGLAGPTDVVKHLVRTEGISSVFRGSAATLLRDGTGSYAYFAVYEYIKRALTPAGQTLSPFAIIMGGGFAGVCNWLVALPFDVIKSRIQVNTQAGVKRSILSIAQELVRNEGLASLYKGLMPALARAFPANAACFMGMEMSKSFLDKLL